MFRDRSVEWLICRGERMDSEFTGELWFWKGPAPLHFITVLEEDYNHLDAIAANVGYRWGMIPVTAEMGETEWKTSLFPKDGRYIVPMRTDVRRAEGLKLRTRLTVHLVVDV